MIYKNGWCVNKFQQKYLFFTCNLTGITSVFASHILKVSPLQYIPIYSIWITSILYWWDPVSNWRRTLDVFVSHASIGFFSLSLLYFRPKYWLHCFAGITLSSVLFRTLSLQCSDELATLHDENCPLEAEGVYSCPTKNSLSWKSVLHHSGIHIFTNLAAFISLFFYREQQQQPLIK